MQKWKEIRYREFHDIPRTFLTEWNGRHLLFDCAFNDDADEYPDVYRVFELPQQSEKAFDESWELLAHQAIRDFGEIPTRELVFDTSKRLRTDFSTIERWGSAHGWW